MAVDCKLMRISFNYTNCRGKINIHRSSFGSFVFNNSVMLLFFWCVFVDRISFLFLILLLLNSAILRWFFKIRPIFSHIWNTFDLLASGKTATFKGAYHKSLLKVIRPKKFSRVFWFCFSFLAVFADNTPARHTGTAQWFSILTSAYNCGAYFLCRSNWNDLNNDAVVSNKTKQWR